MPDDKWYARRTDLYHIDPRTITVIDGFNPRKEFALDDLIPSIRESGVKVPLRVSRNAEGRIELRDGERRYRAVMTLIDEGCPILTVPCVMEIDPATKRRPSEADMLLNAMLANTGKPFTPAEEAEGFRRFLAWGWAVEQLAQRLGKSANYVRNRLTFLEATPETLQAVGDTVAATDVPHIVREASRTGREQAEVLASVVEKKSQPRASQAPKTAKAASEQFRALLEAKGAQWMGMQLYLQTSAQELEAILAEIRTLHASGQQQAV